MVVNDLKCKEFGVLQNSYIVKRKAEVGVLMEAFEAGRDELLVEVFSHVRENASSFGFPLMEKLACSVRKALLSGHRVEARSLLASYHRLLEVSMRPSEVTGCSTS